MKRKYKLTEALQYTPEKELEFLEQAKKDLANAKEIYSKLRREVLSLDLDYLMNHGEEVKKLIAKISQAAEAVANAYSKYSKIIDAYEYTDSKTIDNLDTVSMDIDSYRHKISRLEDFIDDLIKAVDIFIERDREEDYEY